MREFVIAVVVALLGALAVVGWDCHVGTHEACLVAKGMFLYVWGGLIIILWPLAVGIRVLIQTFRPKDTPSA